MVMCYSTPQERTQVLRSSGAVGPETRPLCHVPEWVGDRVGGDNVDQAWAGPALCQVLSVGHVV